MTSGKRLAVAIGIGLLTVFGSLSAAQAQYRGQRPYYGPPPTAPRGVYRHGLTLGGSIGAGLIDGQNCTSPCGGAGMGEVHLGGMLNPRMALMGDLWMGIHRFNDSAVGYGTTYNTFGTIALQFWATDIIWLKGGVGLANVEITSDSLLLVLDDETGLGVMGAAGVEVVHGYNFALDLQLRVGHAFYEGGDLNNLAFMVGFNWY